VSILIAREIWCDICSEWVRLDSGETVADRWPEMSADGWTRKGGRHFCPECSEKMKNTLTSREEGIYSSLQSENTTETET
jgi:hypothetical protein